MVGQGGSGRAGRGQAGGQGQAREHGGRPAKHERQPLATARAAPRRWASCRRDPACEEIWTNNICLWYIEGVVAHLH